MRRTKFAKYSYLRHVPKIKEKVARKNCFFLIERARKHLLEEVLETRHG